MNRGISFVLVPLVALLAGGAGVLYARKEAPVAAASPVQSAALAKLLALELPDTKGVKQPLAQWKGKVLVVNFWATWCPPCRKEMPALSAMSTSTLPFASESGRLLLVLSGNSRFSSFSRAGFGAGGALTSSLWRAVSSPAAAATRATTTTSTVRVRFMGASRRRPRFL